MLQVNPSITITRSPEDGFQLILFMCIDCEAGPNEMTLVKSISEFEVLYSCRVPTQSYLLAQLFLNLGYALQLQKINSKAGRSSLLLSSSEANSVSFPVEGVHYEPLFLDVQNKNENGIPRDIDITNLSTFGFEIKFPKAGIKLEEDYILLNTNSEYWFNITFTDSKLAPAPDKPPISTNVAVRYRELDLYTWRDEEGNYPVTEDKMYTLIDTIEDVSPLRVFKPIVDPKYKDLEVKPSWWVEPTGKPWYKEDDNYYYVRFMSSSLSRIPASSFSINQEPIIDNYVKTRYLIDTRSALFRSKTYDSTSNLEIVIQFMGKGRPMVIINKYALGSLIAKETYELQGYTEKEATDKINYSSQLVECEIYNLDTLLTGRYNLGYLQDRVESTSDMYETSIAYYQDIPADVILDDLSAPLSYFKTLLNLADTSTLLLSDRTDSSGVPDRVEIPNIKGVCYFKNSLIYNEVNYPGFLSVLYLLSTTSGVEGYLPNEMVGGTTEPSSSILDEENPLSIYLNTINTSNYGTEVLNPMMTLLGSEVSLVGGFKVLLVVNKTTSKIMSAAPKDESEVRLLYQKVLTEVDNYINSSTVVSLDSVKINNRELELVFSSDIKFSYNKEFKLNINLIV